MVNNRLKINPLEVIHFSVSTHIDWAVTDETDQYP